MRAVVCAYGEVGYACLDELLAIGADVRLVVTHADARGEKIWFRSVAVRARSAQIPVLIPADVNAAESLARIVAAEPDLLLSFYFRQMMSPALLATARVAALNLHGSLLPSYRGRAPINWVLVNGEAETGVTLHDMDAKPDHGDIVAQRRIAIAADDTALSLTMKAADEARTLIRETYPLLLSGSAPRIPQDHSRSTYFGGRRPEDGRIDWHRPAASIRNLVRAVTAPWPGAFALLGGRKLLVWATAQRARPDRAPVGEIALEPDGTPVVACGDGALALQSVSWAGAGPALSGAAWTKVEGIESGARFDPSPDLPGAPAPPPHGSTR